MFSRSKDEAVHVHPFCFLRPFLSIIAATMKCFAFPIRLYEYLEQFFFFFFSRASNKVKTIFVFSFCRERKAREKEKWFSSEKLFKNDGRVRFKQFAPPKAGFPKKDCCTVGKLLSFQFQFDATFGDSSTGSRISRKTTLDFLVNRFFFSPHEWIQIFPAFITTYATVIFSSFFFHF